MNKKILEAGHRVIWQKGAAGTPHKATVYYATEDEAERMAESIRAGGDRVVRIEFKKGA